MKKLIFSTALMLMAVASRAQSIGVYIYDNDGDFTNIRNAPKGKIVFKLPSREGVMIGVDKVVNGWWHGFTVLLLLWVPVTMAGRR